jgi:hypothetical protein
MSIPKETPPHSEKGVPSLITYTNHYINYMIKLMIITNDSQQFDCREIINLSQHIYFLEYLFKIYDRAIKPLELL